LNQETGIRGFAISGDDTSLDPYTRGTTDGRTAITQLRARRAVRAELVDVEAAAASWHRTIAEPAIAASRAGDARGATALVGQTASFDRLRAALTSLMAATTRHYTSARSRATQYRRVINGVIAALLVLGVIGTVIAAYLVRRWVTRPVRVIGNAVREVYGGSLDTTVPAVGPPELAELGYETEEMRTRLVGAVRDARRAREAVEQNAGVVLDLQANLQPELPKLGSGWSVAADLLPAEGIVAGDCYDVMEVGPRAVAAVVVDVAGHGAIGGILALRCRDLLRSVLVLGADPDEALLSTIRQLVPLDPEMFFTAFVAVSDLDTGRTQYANAGHPPALLCDGKVCTELEPTGPIMSSFLGEWTTKTATIGAGHTLLIYTDGITEARDGRGEFFGSSPLERAVTGPAREGAAAVVARCRQALDDFAPARLRDDATLVVLQRA
jgi:sigma-B regulation protein RsbU (phosphoserine phosphatase)